MTKSSPGLSALPQAPLAIGQDDDAAEAVLFTIQVPHIGDVGEGFVCAVAAGAAYGVGTQGFDGQFGGAAPGQIGAAIVLIKKVQLVVFLNDLGAAAGHDLAALVEGEVHAAIRSADRQGITLGARSNPPKGRNTRHRRRHQRRCHRRRLQ